MSARPAKKRPTTKQKKTDPRLQAHRLMQEFADPDDVSQVHTRDLAVHVATAWALLSIADSLATKGESTS